MRAEPSTTSTVSTTSTTSSALLLALLLAGTGFCAQPAPPKLLPETVVLDRVDGRLLHADANDTWLFELTMEVKTRDYSLPAGTRFVLLPSNTLGRLVADVNERVAPRYRLSARVTRFRGKNYLYPIFYLPLSKFKDDKSSQEGGQATEGGEQKTEGGIPNPQSEIRKPQAGAPELAIPPEVLEQLKKQRPLPGPRKSPRAGQSLTPAPRERVLVDCVGRIESGTMGSQPACPPDRGAQNASGKTPPYDDLPGLIFVPYALGWNLSDVRYELLPSQALEEALQKQARAFNPIRFNVAGLVSEFQGRKYLLLQRAVIVYNYGNFGR